MLMKLVLIINKKQNVIHPHWNEPIYFLGDTKQQQKYKQYFPTHLKNRSLMNKRKKWYVVFMCNSHHHFSQMTKSSHPSNSFMYLTLHHRDMKKAKCIAPIISVSNVTLLCKILFSVRFIFIIWKLNKQVFNVVFTGSFYCE